MCEIYDRGEHGRKRLVSAVDVSRKHNTDNTGVYKSDTSDFTVLFHGTTGRILQHISLTDVMDTQMPARPF